MNLYIEITSKSLYFQIVLIFLLALDLACIAI